MGLIHNGTEFPGIHNNLYLSGQEQGGFYLDGMLTAKKGVRYQDWIVRDVPNITIDLVDITFIDDYYIAIGNIGTTGYAIRSQTGKDGWEIVGTFANTVLRAIASGNGVTIILSSLQTILRSTDTGLTWSSVTARTGYGLCYGANRFVIVGGTTNNAYSAHSLDFGLTWDSAVATTWNNAAWKKVAYGLNVYFAITNDPAITVGSGLNTSADGRSTWTVRTSPTGIRLWTGIDCGPQGFAICASTGEIVTASSVTSIVQRNAPVLPYTNLKYCGNMYVALSPVGIATSPDIVNWTQREVRVQNNWVGLIDGTPRAVCVANSGAGNRIMTSL